MDLLPVCLMIAVLASLSHVDCQSRDQPEFDREFRRFLQEHDYSGGAVAAMKDGRLLHAQGYGFDHQGHEVKASSHFPVSSLAKSLTAVSVLRLVQTGQIGLDDQVFGALGLLSDISPYSEESVPPELYAITVDHLLRHTAGWDVTKAPLYDPLLNEVYLRRGHDVPNIAEEMGVLAPVLPEELISYVMSLPLAFTPGTRVAYSNMAYLVLGRVVEAVSGMEYRDYVKRYILDQCGMWSTRLELSLRALDAPTSPTDTHDSVYDLLDPEAIDSALGWYSNVFDLSRFTRCIFETRAVLDDNHLELLLARPSSAPVQHDDTWYCAGFRTNSRGAVWQDADLHANDLILYHDTAPHGEDGEPKAHRPDTWVVLLHDRSVNHLRHRTRELMTLLGGGAQDAGENLFAWDLSAFHKHPLWNDMPRRPYAPEYTINYQLDEHHLTAYVVALQDEGFVLDWFTTYSRSGHTYFLVLGRKAQHLDEVDFVFQHGLSHRTLLGRKLQLEQAGYNMTQLQSYKSRSHAEPTSFAAVFRQRAFSLDTQMKYGTSHLPEPYEKLVQMYYEKDFYPISQSVVFQDKDEEFSFIYIKENRDRRVDFTQYYDLSTKRLSKLTMDNAKAQLRLSYLNSYDVKGKFKFSAVFTNTTTARGLLEVDQPADRATEITIDNLASDMVPKYVVPYLNKDKELRLAIYYQQEQ